MLRENGYRAEVTEHWNAYARIRKDLFGFIDIVALRGNEKGVLGIQTTSAANLSARIEKTLGLPVYKLWLQCGNRIEFHGWRKIKVRKGGKQIRWEAIVRRLHLDESGAPITTDSECL